MFFGIAPMAPRASERRLYHRLRLRNGFTPHDRSPGGIQYFCDVLCQANGPTRAQGRDLLLRKVTLSGVGPEGTLARLRAVRMHEQAHRFRAAHHFEPSTPQEVLRKIRPLLSTPIASRTQ
jgi:hypothetical protein